MWRMTPSGEWRVLAVDLPPGTTAKFRLQCRGRDLDGFIVHHDDGYAAYVNRCPHVGTPLDLWPNEFLAEDAHSLICSTHGAAFLPATGECTMGPCAGDALVRLPVRCDGDAVLVGCPPP